MGSDEGFVTSERGMMSRCNVLKRNTVRYALVAVADVFQIA